MTLQFIQDNRGNTPSVFIHKEELPFIKTKYLDLQEVESGNIPELTPWQKQIINEH